MAELNVPNRTLFIRDNLPILRGINSESVDLIATDPPFNKGVKAFEGIVDAGEGKGGTRVKYKDVWTWKDDVHEDWVIKIREEHPALHSVIQAANAAAGHDMGAFLCWLAVRVLECHRILKPTGSMYLHCDHTAGAWIRAMMDAIFGRDNFRNEIVWSYQRWTGATTTFQRMHDTLLFYRKTERGIFNQLEEPYSLKSMHKGRRHSTVTTTGLEQSYTDDTSRMKAMRDVWEITYLNSQAKERTGYPTQKPLALYERALRASSNAGDVVLDPFAGCATTCVAAESLGRKWIGIDINSEARGVLHNRLQREVRLWSQGRYRVRVATKAPARTDDGELAAPELVLEAQTPRAKRIPTPLLRAQLLKDDGLLCQGCGWKPPYEDHLHIDHLQPRRAKGTDDIENRALLCMPCNNKKSGVHTLDELRDARLAEGRMEPEFADWWRQEKEAKKWRAAKRGKR